ncbi:hypothetical protein MUP77_20990, partial [Candidatus Bathyarchaeota archaeon]|nr:hypothetical protein [Candidatus Bathyarchaeota archaeon]
MKPNNSIAATLCVVTIVFFLLVSVFLQEPLIGYMGILFAVVVFILSRELLHIRTQDKSWIIAFDFAPFVLFIYALSVIVILSVSPYRGTILEWTSIPAPNWMRYFSAIALTSCLPGYLLLSVLDKDYLIKGTARLVLSYCFSILTTFIAGFLILLSGNTISGTGLQAIIAVNSILIAVYIFLHKKKMGKAAISISFDNIPLMAVLLIPIFGSVGLMIYNFPLTYGDTWRHLEATLQYSKRFPLYGTTMLPSAPYSPYLFHIYLSILSAGSGLPSATAIHALYPLGFISVLAFYSCLKAWFTGNRMRNIPLIASFLSTLLGFGSLYVIFLNLTGQNHDVYQLLQFATNKTYDLYMRVLFLPDIVAPLWNVGLPVLFMLLYMMKSNCGEKSKVVIFASMVLLGYLGHIAEVIIFTFLNILYVVLFKKDWKVSIAIFVGLLAVGLIDFLAPSHDYLFVTNDIDGRRMLSPYYVITLLGSAVATMIAAAGEKNMYARVRVAVISKVWSLVVRTWKFSRWSLLYIYVFCIIVWSYLLNDYSVSSSGSFTFVPFFVFPLRLGPVGLLFIVALIVCPLSIMRSKEMLFFILMAALGVVAEQGANYHSEYYAPYRFATMTFLGMCPLASYGLQTTVDY